MKVAFEGTRNEILDQMFSFFRHDDFEEREIELPLFSWQSETMSAFSVVDVMKVNYSLFPDSTHLRVCFKETSWFLVVRLNEKGSPEIDIYEDTTEEEGGPIPVEVTSLRDSSSSMHTIQVRELPKSAPQQKENEDE